MQARPTKIDGAGGPRAPRTLICPYLCVFVLICICLRLFVVICVYFHLFVLICGHDGSYRGGVRKTPPL